MRILDDDLPIIGCGIGKHAKEYIKKGAQVTGIDASEEMIKITKNVCGDEGNFFVANFEEVKFDKKSFDLIVGFSFLEWYVPKNKIEFLLKEIMRVGTRGLFGIGEPRNEDRKSVV